MTSPVTGAVTDPGRWKSRVYGKYSYLFCAVLVFSFLSGAVVARPLDDVVKSGFLTVFVYKDYAPYSWNEDDQLMGIDVDIARVFGESLGVEIRFLVRGADENVDDDLRVNIWKGDLIHRKAADVMMHVPYDREVDIRNEFVVLSAPYFSEQMAVVADKAVLPKVENFARFVRKPIGVEVDTIGDFFLSNAFGGQLQQSVQRGRTFAAVVSSYNSGEVPAVMGSRAQTEWIKFQAEKRESHIVQPPMPGIVRNSWPIGIAVKHDSRDLAYALEDVITELMRSGKIEAITRTYGVSWISPENR